MSNEYQVMIEGKLPDKASAAMNRAIQRAVMAELAELDLLGSVKLQGGPIGGGQTDGLWIEIDQR